MRPWLVLLAAGIFEICWAVGLKLSNGLTRVGWTLFTAATLVLSMALLARSLRELPLGTAYAVWTGIGALGTAVVGIVVLDESREPLRLLFLLMILAGIVGLRVVSGTAE